MPKRDQEGVRWKPYQGFPPPRSAERESPIKNAAENRRHFYLPVAQAFLFSQGWLATPQLVLQALWQEVWHSPQPPLTALAQRLRVSRVFILFISIHSYL